MKITNTFLDKILTNKIREIETLSRVRSLKSLQSALLERKTEIRDFFHAVKHPRRLSLIAEIKKSSPSAGLIKKDFDHVKIAREYEKSKLVDAISILTEKKYFQGDIKFISDIKKVTSVPILRKDFIFDEYQIYESYLAEADAILLIVKMLEHQALRGLIELTEHLGMDCLVETHSKKEIAIALNAGAKIIGINSRDLKKFKVNRYLFKKLVKYIPYDIARVAESGLEDKRDLEKTYIAGANAVLIGTAIMKSKNIKGKIKELVSLV